jgi:hypothetical protein
MHYKEQLVIDVFSRASATSPLILYFELLDSCLFGKFSAGISRQHCQNFQKVICSIPELPARSHAVLLEGGPNLLGNRLRIGGLSPWLTGRVQRNRRDNKENT